MKVAIVDDRPEELNRILQITEKALPQAILFTFPSGEAFLETWKHGEYDLVLLDIFMDRILGIDVAKKVREDDKDVRLVFCTTSNEFACESYEVGANYYLQKPISETSFAKMLEMIRLDHYEKNRFITLPDGQQIVLRNITYTEYYNHSIIIHSKKRADLQTRMSQTEWEELLAGHGFFSACSKGIVVNFYEVERIENGMFLLQNGDLVPISRRKTKEVTESYARFCFEQMRKGEN